MAYIEKSKTDNWKTPKVIYDYFMGEGYYDPCPYESSFDGLSIEWQEKNFVNPPYSKLKIWIEKSIEENRKKKQVVLLIPSRTDTKGFKMLFDHGCKFYFVHGRLHFNDSSPAPFPSVFVVLKGDGHSEIHITERSKLYAKEENK